MTPQELKNSILQRAIQGKLVPQDPSEGTGEDLYKQIQLDDIATVKSEPVFSQDELPFDIPDSWKFVRVENIAILYNGRAYKQSELLEKGKYPVLRVGNLFTSNKWYYSDMELEPEKYCDEGDLLYSWSASFGPYIWTGEKVIYHYHIWKIEFTEWIDKKYLYYFLLADTDSIKQSGHGLAMIHVTKSGTEKRVLPLPPLAEQRRIVGKIEELLPLIDRYEEAWTKLEDFNQRFPGDMQKSILQMAIQGKLVPQNPSEGTGDELYEQIQLEREKLIEEGKIKKEKKFAPIAEDEKPFNVPDNWTWVRFGNLGSYKKGPFGSALTKSMFVPKGPNAVKVYEQKNAIQKDSCLGEYYITRDYFESKMAGFEVHPGDIIVSCAGTIGETYVMPNGIEQGIINQALMRMRIFEPMHIPYFLMFFDFVLKQNARSGSKGSAIKNIPPFEVLKNYLVPIPPLAEQKRIVEKLDNIIPMCEKLESITKSNNA